MVGNRSLELVVNGLRDIALPSLNRPPAGHGDRWDVSPVSRGQKATDTPLLTIEHRPLLPLVRNGCLGRASNVARLSLRLLGVVVHRRFNRQDRVLVVENHCV